MLYSSGQLHITGTSALPTGQIRLGWRGSAVFPQKAAQRAAGAPLSRFWCSLYSAERQACRHLKTPYKRCGFYTYFRELRCCGLQKFLDTKKSIGLGTLSFAQESVGLSLCVRSLSSKLLEVYLLFIGNTLKAFALQGFQNRLDTRCVQKSFLRPFSGLSNRRI